MQKLGRKEAKLEMSVPQTGLYLAYKRLKPPRAKPLTTVQVAEDREGAKPKGTLLTDPKEVDEEVRHAWGSIYTGNAEDQGALVEAFLEEYGPYIRRVPQEAVLNITGEEVKEACCNCKKSAGGPDGWLPIDMAMLSDLAYDWIARILNAIEMGAPWPKGTLEARAAFLAKDSQKQ